MKKFFLFILIFQIIIIHADPNYPDIFYKLYVKACSKYDANFEAKIKNEFSKLQLDFTMDFLCFKPNEKKTKLKKYLDNSKLVPILNLIINSKDLTEVKEEGRTSKLDYFDQSNVGEHIYYHVLGKKISKTNEKCLMIEQIKTNFIIKKNRECSSDKIVEILIAYERNVLYGNNKYFSIIVNNSEKSLSIADNINENFV